MSGVIGGVATIGASLIGGLFASGSARKQRRQQEKLAAQARKDKKQIQGELRRLEGNRQAIINPFAGITDLSGMIEDTSSLLSNPFANLGVATQAAEFQAEEADIALANTLDTLQATGASAGGATALAQAALQSKRGISSSIQQQEAQNARARAEGESNLQARKQQEAVRVQSAKFGEAGRQQQADVAGKEFVFGQQERREGERLNRLQAQVTNQAQAEQAYNANAAQAAAAGTSAVGNIISSGVQAIGSAASNYAKNKALDNQPSGQPLPKE